MLQRVDAPAVSEVVPPPHAGLGSPAVGMDRPDRTARIDTAHRSSEPSPGLLEGLQQPASRGADAVPLAWGEPLPIADRSSALETLCHQVAACKRCEVLAQRRLHTVFGEGPVAPRACFFGEAPGADEDREGRPFVGRSGQLLDKMIAACQLQRSEVYILNTLKCRPPDNRTPLPEEIEHCRGYFEQQFEILQPQFIVCLGLVALKALFPAASSVGTMRGRLHPYRGAQVIATYHPSYLLRQPDAKRAAWSDLQLLMRALGIPLPNR